MKIHPKAVKGDKSQVGAPMPGTVLSEYRKTYVTVFLIHLLIRKHNNTSLKFDFFITWL